MSAGFSSGGTLREQPPNFDAAESGVPGVLSATLFRIWSVLQNRVLHALDKLTYNVGLSWIKPAYAAGDFTAATGTWTVDAADVLDYRYVLIGETMVLSFSIENTDVSAAAAHLRIAVPGGYVIKTGVDTRAIIMVSDAGAATVTAQAIAAGGLRFIQLYATIAGGAWTITAADNTDVYGEIVFQVERGL